MAGDNPSPVDLAIRTLAYLKACDPYYPKSDGADGEARVLAWARHFGRHKLEWRDIEAAIDSFFINAPTGAHCGLQDVLRGALSARRNRVADNPHWYEQQAERIALESERRMYGIQGGDQHAIG